jgi:amino acid adenylation domain-containing protein
MPKPSDDWQARLAALSPEQRAALERRLQSVGIAPPPMVQASQCRTAPLSFGQQRLWFLHQLDDAPVYHVPLFWQLDGRLDHAALERSLHAIIRRHTVLRSTLHAQGGQLTQRVGDGEGWWLAVTDLTDLADSAARATVARQQALEAARRPFDLARDAMVRAELWRTAPQAHFLLLTLHHIACDGWSLALLCQELAALYEAFLTGRTSPLPELRWQYLDYALWQQSPAQEAVYRHQLAYWVKQLADVPAALELSSACVHPATPSQQGSTLRFALDVPLVLRLKHLGRQRQASLFMTLLAAFQLLLHRYTGQADIVVGCPATGRDRAAWAELIGFFVNTLALRANLAGNPTFTALLDRVRDTALQAFAHQDVPFERVVDAVRPERRARHQPLCQVMFALHEQPVGVPQLTGAAVHPLDLDLGTAKFDLTLSLVSDAGRLAGALECRTACFDSAAMERLVAHFRQLLEEIADQPERPIGELCLLTAAERQQLLIDWNDSTTAYPHAQGVHQLFEAAAAQFPDHCALAGQNGHWTYRELNGRANQLARHLCSLGVGPGERVGVALERSPELIVALLGILKAGAAYLPLDLASPVERLAFMLADSRPRLLLTDTRLMEKLPPVEIPVVALDRAASVIAAAATDNLALPHTPDALAYLMYTSGSTGRPKGVAVGHRAIARLVVGAVYVQLDASTRMLCSSPIAFDASTFEIWGPLLHGGCCVVFPDELPSPSALTAVLVDYDVNTLFLTTALFNTLVDLSPATIASVRQLLVGGEAQSVEHVRRFLRHGFSTRLTNVYGPTEATVFACFYPVPPDLDAVSSIPIGRPIQDTEAYVLDDYRQPVPVGVAGELYLGGPGLAQGYWERPALTAERFLPHPLGPNRGPVYRTGDRVRWRAEGQLEFLGRVDRQLKVRGLRIEPGEVEEALMRHPSVRLALVTAHEVAIHDRRLTAYLVPAGQPPTRRALLAHLEQLLPAAWIPSAFMLLHALPLTSNGKVNHAALPVPPSYQPTAAAPPPPPPSPLLAQLTEIFEIVLNVRPVRRHDNFFALGGHSLLAMRLLHEIEEHFGQGVALASLYEEPTVAGLARALLAGAQHQFASLATTVRHGSLVPLFFLHGDYAGGGFYALKMARSLDADRPVHLVHPHALAGQTTPPTIEAMAESYLPVLRRLHPSGPCVLAGHCNGGLVAFELARQMRNQGLDVSQVALIHVPSVRRRPRSGQLPRPSREAPALTLEQLYRRAVRRYVPQPYPGPIALFDSATERAHAEPTRGWDRVAASVSVRYLPGDHFSALTTYGDVLARSLNECLRAAGI